MGALFAKQPIVSSTYAVACASALAAGFVLILYALPGSIRQLPRDHAQHVLCRIGVISLFCLVSITPLFYLGDRAPTSVLRLTGLSPDCNPAPAAASCLALMICLFTGPCIEHLLTFVEEEDAALSRRTLLTLPSFRDLLFAPAAEEWVFRCCTLPLFALALIPLPQALTASAVAFAAAHAHHILDLRKQGYALSAALARVALMLSYTSVFGAMAGFAFWYTGSAWGVMLMHAFCNMMGLPHATFMSPYHPVSRRVCVAGMYAVGIVAFVALALRLPTWTSRTATPCALAMYV